MTEEIRAELLTAGEVAKMLGFKTRGGFNTWLRKNPDIRRRFPRTVSLGGRIRKYRRRQIEAFIDLMHLEDEPPDETGEAPEDSEADE